MKTIKKYDVIIIGGSYSGLSAAMSLGRSRRNVLILDSGLPCNRQTPHSHNFITQDGVSPGEIAAKAKEQVLRYDTVQFKNALAVDAVKMEESFEVITADKETFSAKKLIFATGVADQMQNIKGFSECWGISVIHCPYCHGYEFRDEKTAILANNETVAHMSPLIANLSKDFTVLTNGPATLSEEQKQLLTKNKVSIVEAEIAKIVHENGYVKRVVFKDSSSKEVRAIYAPVPFKQHSNIPEKLGCELNESGYIKIDDFFSTTVPGVLACGDNTGKGRSVAFAVHSGGMAGAVANKLLADEAFAS